MTDDQIAALVHSTAEEVAKRTIREMFVTFGIDVTNPMEMQQDMAYLRAWRTSVGTIKKQGLMTAVGIVTIGVLGLIWSAMKTGAGPQ